MCMASFKGATTVTDKQYHAERARIERDIAYRAADARVSDAHMRLSALHLSRALLPDEMDSWPKARCA